MAIVLNGFMGDAVGKLGNVIFRKWNSLHTASQYQPIISNPNTPGQKVQRTKIKSLSLALVPFKDTLIPLNFKNKKGLSTSWAEAIRANYPKIDDDGNIAFKDMILSGGTLMPPSIIAASYDPFINLLKVNYNLVNKTHLDQNLVRVSGAGKMLSNGNFNTANICKRPVENGFASYIEEINPPDYPVNFNFDNAWAEGMIFYNLVNTAIVDARAYSPRKIANTASAGNYFEVAHDDYNLDYSFALRLVMPSQFHVSTAQDGGNYFLHVSIDDFSTITGMLASDKIIIMFKVMEQNAHTYNTSYSFQADAGQITIPLQEGDQEKPFMFLYYVTDEADAIKSAVTRIDFNFPANRTFCELLFSNGFIHPESIKIHKPFTAIWGDLKTFIPLELIGTTPFQIFSKNVSTSEETEHVFNSDKLFLCSKLIRNQLYTITITDGVNTIYQFSTIGIDSDYCMTGENSSCPELIKFEAGADLAAKVN